MSKKYLLIQNTGEVEVEGFKLLGASTKRCDASKIGFFGSGIKYTVSYLLRNDMFFTVYSGRSEVKFETKEVTLRGQSFEKVLVNGEETSITTSWGENWNKWQIFREIVSNSLDEETYSLELVDEINPVAGLTNFYVDYEDFKEYYDNLDRYFNFDFLKSTKEAVIPKPKISPLNVFKRGVTVLPDSDDPIMSLFDYHLPDIDLNEERVASIWDIRYDVTQVLLRLKNSEQVDLLYSNLIRKDQNIFEVQEVFSNLGDYHRLSNTWLDVLNASDAKVLPAGNESFIEEERGKEYIEEQEIKFIPDTFNKVVKRSFGDKFTGTFDSKEVTASYIVMEKTGTHEELLYASLESLNSKGISIQFNDIEVVLFKDPKIRSYSEDGKIYLSSSCFEKELVSATLPVLLEGYIKSRYKVQDKTREMQEACLEVLTGLILS